MHKTWLPHVFLSMIGLAVLWAYQPCLLQIPKHDQIMYLASIAGKDDFFSLAFGNYALNRTISFCVLDPFLFRPLLYFFLGTEQFLFKYNFAAWQLVNILGHLAVVLSLYALLRVIRPGWPAAFAAGFFALLMVNTSLVNWPNIGPYLIFMALFLFIIRECYLFHSGQKWIGVKRLAGLLFIAILINEAGIFFAVPLFFYFFNLLPRDKRQQAFWIAFSVALYLAVSILDLFFVHPYVGFEPARMASGLFSWKIPVYFVITLKWFLMGGIFAAPTEMADLGRTILLPHTFAWGWPFTTWSPYVLRGLAFLAVCGTLIVTGATNDFFKKHKAFYYLLSSMILVYVLMIVCGRMTSRGILGGPFLNCYYFYFFWMIVVVLFYSLVDWARCFAYPYWRTVRIIAVFVMLLMLTAGAFSLRAVNAMVARAQTNTRVLLTYTEAFVQAHKDEPDFTFFIPYSCPGNYPGRWFHRYGEPKWSRYTLVETFYPQYYRRKKAAKYVIGCPIYPVKSPVKERTGN